MRQLQKFMKYNRTFCQEGLGHLCCTSGVEQTFCCKAVTLKWSLLISAAVIKILSQAAEVLCMSLRRPHFTSLNCDLTSVGIKWAAKIYLGGRSSSGSPGSVPPGCPGGPYGSFWLVEQDSCACSQARTLVVVGFEMWGDAAEMSTGRLVLGWPRGEVSSVGRLFLSA